MKPSDRTAAPEPPTFEVPPPAVLSLDEQSALDLHRQINARRAQVEKPELLRNLRSL